MAGEVVAAVVVILIAVMIGAGLFVSVRKYGWPGTWRYIQLLPTRICRWITQSGASRGRRRGKTGTIPIEQLQFTTFTDRTHKVSVKYPSSWTISRSENPSHSLIVQMVCDSREESYKRVTLAWDDVSWSNVMADKFARGMIDNLQQSATNCQLISHGPHRSGPRADNAYEVQYSVPDSVDGSTLHILSVIMVSNHGGQRRAFTVSFVCDAPAFHEALPLARYITDSVTFDDVTTISPASTAGVDDVHIPVWERERSKLLSEESGLMARSAPIPSAVITETPSDPPAVSWTTGAITQAGLSYSHPASWLCSGLGHDESLGFSPIAVHSVRRWCIAHTCDKRESSFKHLSVICVDITPCYDIIMARVAKNSKVLQGADPGTILLSYLTFRYRSELAEAAAFAAARAPAPPALLPGEEIIKPWMDVFGQRWPPTCRLSTPLSPANAAQVIAPIQTAVSDHRVIQNSRLFKVTGWLRTTMKLDSTGSSGPRSRDERRSSTYSTLSMENEAVPAEGLQIQTTSAVLFGIHEAVVATGAQRTAAKGTVSAAMQKRIFGHVVAFGTASDVFQTYEGLAKHIFRSLTAGLS